MNNEPNHMPVPMLALRAATAHRNIGPKMNLVIFGLLALVLTAVHGFASDDTYKKGVPGTYVRVLGMEATQIELLRDGSYVITVSGCVWSEKGKGHWSVENELLVLDGRGHPKEKKGKLTKFEIVALDGDLALRPKNDEIESEDHDAEIRLFKSVRSSP
jgi:hypothetical protein